MKRDPLAKGSKITIDNKTLTIKEVCGRGTSSIVYYAEDNDQKVIVKEIYPAGLGIKRANSGSLLVPDNNREFFDTYIDRANSTFEIQKELHNNEKTNHATLFTYGKGECNDTVYYASEYNAGCTLKEWIKKERIKDNRNNVGFIPDLLKICSRIADVLQEYHKKGLMHLDVKPDNILVEIGKDDYYIRMFDFDSVYSLDDIKSEYVRYSPGYVAPEVEYFPQDIDLNRTDIFSVGAILYEGVFGDIPPEDVQDYRYEFDYSKIDALKSLSPELQPVLTEIFRRTLSIVVSSRYSGEKNDDKNDDLASALLKAYNIAKYEYYLANDDIQWNFTEKKLLQRTKELENIHEALQKKKLVYLYGTGGTGKTWLTKAYAAKYKNEYVFVQSVKYNRNLKDTLNDIRVDSSNSNTGKKPAGVELLGKITAAKTLIIIDNYECKDSEAEELLTLLKNSYSSVRFIMTSRTEPETLFETVEDLKTYFFSYTTDKTNDPDFNNALVYPDFNDALVDLFFANACDGLREKENTIKEKYKKDVRSFTEKYHHIMLTVLASRFAKTILIHNREGFPDFLDKLNKDVSFGKNESHQYQKQVYDKLSALFDVADFDDEKKRIMLNACVMAQNSIKEDLFCVMAGIELDKWTNTNSTVNELVSSSWLVREIKRERFGSGQEKYPHIEIHPLIAQVCMEKLLPEVDLEKTFSQTAENLSGLFKMLIGNDINTIPQNCMDMVSNLFRMIDRVMDNTKSPKPFSSRFCKTLIDLLSYYVPANRLYDGITACMIFLRLKPQEKRAKEKLVRIIGLYKEAYDINDLSEPYREAYDNAVSELCDDPSSVLSIGMPITELASILNTLSDEILNSAEQFEYVKKVYRLTITEKASNLNTLAKESQYSAEQVEYAKKAYELIIKENLKDECALGEIFRCGLTLLYNKCLDEAKQCAAYLKKGANNIVYNIIVWFIIRDSNIMREIAKSALTDRRMFENDPQPIMYLVLQGIIEHDSGDYERAMIYLLAADYLCDIYDHFDANHSALHNTEDESIADNFDISYCRRLARNNYPELEFHIFKTLGLIEGDSDKDETKIENIIHKLAFCEETFFFDRRDYVHAANKLMFPKHSFPYFTNDDEKIKKIIIEIYREQSRKYNDENNDRMAKLYEERAAEIERNFDSRKNIFEEILSDFK